MRLSLPILKTRSPAVVRGPHGVSTRLTGLRRQRSGGGSRLSFFRLQTPVWTALLTFAVALLSHSNAIGSEDAGFRVGFSSAMFTDVNENDAKAAVKVWGQTIAKERGIPTDPETRIFHDTSALAQALRDKSVDAVGITIIEYAAVSPEVRFAPIFVAYTGGRNREEFVLLVHRESGIERLTDLRTRNLTFHENSRVRLAQPWLDTLLIEAGGKSSAEWLGRITRASKLSKVVLPVFFRQGDACVVTRTSFETMCELNPQIGHQLKILARSPAVVPSVFCFRADYAPAFKEDLFAGVRELHKSVAGQQVLTVFQSDKLEDQPASCLDSALELLARHTQLSRPAGMPVAAPASGQPQTTEGANP